MSNSVLEITDGSSSVSLISAYSRGIHVKEWSTTVNAIKGGGVFADNPIANGRQTVLRKWENAVESITLAVSGDDQDGVALQLQAMFDLLEKATEYWVNDNQSEPVYLKFRGATETNFRYAIIHAYQMAELSNPFAMPLYACNPATIDGAILTIERGHWQGCAPGTGDCVEITAKTSAGNPLAKYDRPTASDDDCYVNEGLGTIQLANYHLIMGKNASGNKFHTGVRFTSVNVPSGAEIIDAFVWLDASSTESACSSSGTGTSSCCYVRVYGEDIDDAPAFSTYADFMGRTRTENYVGWLVSGTVVGATYKSRSFVSVIQEIIDRPGWASGNDLVIFFTCLDRTDAGTWRKYASWDYSSAYPSYDPPELVIKYIEDFGQEETCQPYTAFVANKATTNNLTHIFRWNGAVFSGNLTGTALPYQLLPAAPGVNDAIYFGVNTAIAGADQSTFNSLIFDIGTAGDGLLQWEYWNGAWTALTVYDTTVDVSDQMIFYTEGVGSVFWEIPYDWAQTTVNAITGWWVRVRVLGGGPTVGAIQQNRQPYTVAWPNVSISEDQIKGDIPALGRIEVTGVSDPTLPGLNTQRVIMGTRIDDRGIGFNPFINLSDVQTLDGVNVSVNGGDVAFTDFVRSATGRVVQYDPAFATTALDPRVYVTFESGGNVWRGRYRAFVRCTSTTSEAFSINLSLYSSTIGVPLISTKPQTVSTALNATGHTFWQLLDFGVIDLPIGRQYFANGDGQNKTMIAINVAKTLTGLRDLYLHDLILMPCDEWYGDFMIPALENWADSGLGNFGVTLAADSLFMPRKQLRTAAGWMATGEQRWEFIAEVWRAGSPGEVVLPPRTACKIYFLSAWWNSDEYWMSYPENGLSVRVHKADRWLGLRGEA